MISKEDILPLLLESCPSFRPIWEREKDEYRDDDGSWLLYSVVGRLGDHVVDQFQAGQLDEVASFFALAEVLHVEGDEFVKELATVGLLEDVQNHALHQSLGLDVFLPFLGPISARRWRELVMFWGQVEEAKQSGRIKGSKIDISRTSPGFRKRFAHLLRPFRKPKKE